MNKTTGRKNANLTLSLVLILLLVFSLVAVFILPSMTGNVSEDKKIDAESYTDDKWSSGKTSNLLPDLSKTGAAGWTLTEDNSPLEIEQVGKGDKREYRLRPANDGHDMGDSNGNYGAYYPVYLSTQDQLKANLGQLTAYSEGRFYKQKLAPPLGTHYSKVKIAFYNGSTLISESTSDHVENINDQLVSHSATVPANTTCIKFGFANWSSGSTRPWVRLPFAKLTDNAAPSITAESFSGGYNVGSTFKYIIDFNEYITAASGTASIKVGSEIPITADPQIDANNHFRVTYTFQMPKWETSGSIAFSAPSFSATDHSGKVLTTSLSANKGYFHANPKVTLSITRLTSSNTANSVAYSGTYTTTLKPIDSCDLPKKSAITVTEGGQNTDFSYNESTGELTVSGVYSALNIIATAPYKKVIDTFDKQGGTGGSDNVNATFNSTYPTITPPTKVGYNFAGYFEKPNGQGTQYFTEGGGGKVTCEHYTGTLTFYAHWTPKEYVVTYDKNKPEQSTPTNDVLGTVADTNHVYDTASKLSSDAYTLLGWTFMGWATTSGGDVAYKSGASVSQLNEGLNTTLYAVWKPNRYTIIYDANKPAGATGKITGTTASSAHDYDYNNTLTRNGYALTGWTFQGWSTTADGDVVYTNEQSVKNLKENNGDKLTIYAVWAKNTYYIRYNKNQPVSKNTISGDMANTTMIYEATGNLTEIGYQLVGWTFKGWATEPKGKVIYADKASVTNLTGDPKGVFNLYAVWDANKYNIKFNMNKPTNASNEIVGTMNNEAFVYDIEQAITTNTWSLVGWTFKGWTNILGGTEVVFADKEVVNNLTPNDNEDYNLYAIWAANTYTITFDTTGGVPSSPVVATYDSKLPVMTTSQKRGYNLKGFFTEPDGKGVMFYDGEGKISNDMTYVVTDTIRLYAYWAPVTYKIHLYSENKFAHEVEMTYGLLLLPDFDDPEVNISKANHDFVGWNVYDNQNWSMFKANTEYYTGLADEQDVIFYLYAAWLERPTHPISFDANGGANVPDVAIVHEKETIKLSSIQPVRTDYTFLGWALDEKAETPDYLGGDDFTMGEEVVTLYAVWKENPILSYNTGEGQFNVSIDEAHHKAGESFHLTTFKPERLGYTFVGWTADAMSTNADYVAGATYIMPDTNTTLYAVWNKTKYTITQNVPDGFAITDLTEGDHYYGDTVTFKVTGVNPKVYADGKICLPIDGVYSFVLYGDANIIIYDSSKYGLIYSANGGINQPFDNKIYATGDVANVSTSEPTRKGYTFEGWYDNPEGNGNVITSVTFGEKDIILYAKWTPIKYFVNFNSNFISIDPTLDPATNELIATQEMTYDKHDFLSYNVFEYMGYSFVGWSNTADGEVLYYDGHNVVNLTDEAQSSVELYAIWENTVTTITFEYGGSIRANSPIRVGYGNTLSNSGLFVPERVGYTFDGYYLDSEALGDMIFDKDVCVAEKYKTNPWDINEQILVLYPKWIANKYNVLYMDGSNYLGGQVATFGEPFTLLKADDEITITAPYNYHFVGWSLQPNGNVAIYNDGQMIGDGLSTNGGDVQLYAVFEHDEMARVIYHANGGTNAPVDYTEYVVDSDVDIDATIPNRDGYIFAGWTYDTGTPADFEYTDGAFNIGTFTMMSGGIDLYAVWTPGETLQKQIDAINADYATLTAAVDTLDTSNTDMKTSFDAFSVELKKATDTIKGVDNTFATDEELAAAVAKLNKAVEEATAVQENFVKTKVNEINAMLKEMKGDIDKVAEEDKKELTNLVTTLEKKVDTVNSSLGTKDTSLSESIVILDDAYRTADEVLLTKIEASIAKLKKEMDGKITDTNNNMVKSDGDITAMLNDFKDDVDTKQADDTKTYAIVNGVIGGIAVILLVILIVKAVKRRKENKALEQSEDKD